MIVIIIIAKNNNQNRYLSLILHIISIIKKGQAFHANLISCMTKEVLNIYMNLYLTTSGGGTNGDVL
jgi:hypothetical protein